MVLRHIATHVQNDIRIPKIDIMIGHRTRPNDSPRAATVAAVSDTGLVFDVNKTECPQKLLLKPALFIIEAALPTEAIPFVRLTVFPSH